MDETQNQQQGQTTGRIVKDPNKSVEEYIREAEQFYIVPMLVRESFPDLIKLIIETESMDLEEQEYWLQIMPIMSSEQIVKFRDILVNEKNQLTKLDQEYDSEISRISESHSRVLDEAKLKQRLDTLKAAESEANAEETTQEENLLKELENL